MCGIIGIYLKKISAEQLGIVKELLIQSGIRGVHATGFSYLKNGKIITKSSHESVSDFAEKNTLKSCTDSDGGLYMIAHTRYSTSDLRFNQPLGDEKLSIVHNGVISQESPRKWKKIFGLDTKTSNDSELIYSCIKSGDEPLVFFRGSMAGCTLTNRKELMGFRNHERPLWYSTLKNGIIFASTNDILVRSGLQKNTRCDMFTKYIFNGKLQVIRVKTAIRVADLQ